MASPVAEETYSVFREETLANERPEMYALSYRLFHKSRAKFAFSKKVTMIINNNHFNLDIILVLKDFHFYYLIWFLPWERQALFILFN